MLDFKFTRLLGKRGERLKKRRVIKSKINDSFFLHKLTRLIIRGEESFLKNKFNTISRTDFPMKFHQTKQFSFTENSQHGPNTNCF